MGKYDSTLYTAVIGSHELSWWNRDDRHARKLVAKWIGLYWNTVRNEHVGSIAHAINTGRYNKPVKLQIGRKWCKGGVVPFGAFTIIVDLPEWNGRPIRYERGMLITDDM